MAELIYRIIEQVDGERGGKPLIPYKLGQVVKVFLLMYFIK